MVYGWAHCKYDEVANALFQGQLDIQKVFCWVLGCKDALPDEVTTLEGRAIEQVEVDEIHLKKTYKKASNEKVENTEVKDEHNDFDSRLITRQCKAGLTNIVFENYKRKKEGLPIIPVIFCVDIENKNSNYAKYESEDITSRSDLLFSVFYPIFLRFRAEADSLKIGWKKWTKSYKQLNNRRIGYSNLTLEKMMEKLSRSGVGSYRT